MICSQTTHLLRWVAETPFMNRDDGWDSSLLIIRTDYIADCRRRAQVIGWQDVMDNGGLYETSFATG